MSRSTNVLNRLWNGFRYALGSREQAAKLVGEDHLGNRYYEKDPDPKRNRRGSRWVESRGQAEGDMTFIPEVPTEWDAWLRRRRTQPPTQEEIERNYVLMVRTQQRARELEARGGKVAGEGQTGSQDEARIAQTISQESYKSKFPKYADYEVSPGQFQDKPKGQ